MGDVGVKLAAPVTDTFLVWFWLLQLLHHLLQGLVAFHYAGLSHFAQRHFLEVIADLFELVVHHLHVEDQLNQVLNFR